MEKSLTSPKSIPAGLLFRLLPLPDMRLSLSKVKEVPALLPSGRTPPDSIVNFSIDHYGFIYRKIYYPLPQLCSI